MSAAPPAHTTLVRVRYADTDKMDVVYYANYFRWFEIGRTEWFRHSGHSYTDIEAGGISLPVLDAACHYRRPARYDDEVAITARTRLVSPVRLRFDYEIRRVLDDLMLATGYTVHAGVNRDGRPCRLPDEVTRLLA